jgi:uncharacterized damage-inducible protein DinB
MVPEYAPIAHHFLLGARALDRLVGDFSGADWTVRDGAGHTPRWITGHLATVRTRAMAMMGLEVPAAPWTEAFGRGTSDADVPGDLDLGQVLAAFREAQERMAARWEALAAEDFSKPLGRTLPDGSDTVGGALRFLAWHEAYHLGQLGLLRPLAGKVG